MRDNAANLHYATEYSPCVVTPEPLHRAEALVIEHRPLVFADWSLDEGPTHEPDSQSVRLMRKFPSGTCETVAQGDLQERAGTSAWDILPTLTLASRVHIADVWVNRERPESLAVGRWLSDNQEYRPRHGGLEKLK